MFPDIVVIITTSQLSMRIRVNVMLIINHWIDKNISISRKINKYCQFSTVKAHPYFAKICIF